MNHTDEVQQSLEEVQGLLAHLETASWVEEDWGILQRILRSYARLLGTLFEAQMTLKRLQALLFGTRRRRRTSSASEASADVVGRGEDAGRGGHEGQGAAWEKARSAAAGHPPRSGGHRPGYGRLGAAVYEGAKRVECRHEDLWVGEVCPVCGQGRLYLLPPGVEMRIDGNALLSAIRYEVEKLRCSACGEVFPAQLPVDAGPEKYSPRARAVLAVGRYYLGVPFYRIEGYQAMVGVPVPDATQWDQIERVADCSYRVFEVLERLAAQGELIYQDDTSVRILALLAENHARHAHAASLGKTRTPARTGMYTTALVVKVGIALHLTVVTSTSAQ
jgi:transposase